MNAQMKWLALLSAGLLSLTAYGLSRSIGRDIEFPKNYNPRKAAAIRKVIQNERYQFTDGTVSYWPPDWSTRLSFEGDASSLSDFLAELRGLDGISLRLILYRGRNDERRRDSSWQLDFSHARPDQLTLYLNLNSSQVDFYKIRFPEWPAR